MTSTAAAQGQAARGAARAATRRAHHAFISYSHAADDRLAPALQKALHQFGKPWWRMRALRVFRDQTSLAADPALWGSIERALADSEWFILMASPGAACSHWVNRECEWWLANRAPSRMLIVLTEGSIAWDRGARNFDAARTTALPPALYGRFDEEPNHVDLHFAKENEQTDQRSLRHAGFRAAILDLAAPIHGVSKDMLDGEDVRQHRRTRWVAGLAVASLVVLAVLATVAAVQAVRQAQEARRGQLVAESRQLAARAQALLGDGRLDAALLHAVEARRALTPEVQAATGEWFDATSGLMAALMNHGAAVDAVQAGNGRSALSADGSTLVLSRGDAAVVWNMSTRSESRRLPVRFQFLWDMALSPDGRRLLLSSQLTSEVLVLDTASGQELGVIRPGTNGFHNIRLSPDGRWLAVAEEGLVTLWDANTLRPSSLSPPRHASMVVGMDFDGASSRLVYGSRDGRVTVMNLGVRTTQDLALQPRPASQTALVLSPDGSRLAAAGDFGLAVWDVATGRRLWSDAQAASAAEREAKHDSNVVNTVVTQTPAAARAAALAGDVVAMAVSPDGAVLATGDDKGVIRRWRMAGAPADGTPALGAPMSLHRGSILSLAFGPDGRSLVSSAGDGQILHWDLSRPHRLMTVAKSSPATTRDPEDDPWLDVMTGQGVQRPADLVAGVMAARRLNRPDRLMAATCRRSGEMGCVSLSVGTWDAAGKRLDDWVIEQGDTAFGTVALGPSGDLVVTARPIGDPTEDADPPGLHVAVWQRGASAPRQVALGSVDRSVKRMSISGDGQVLAVSDSDHVALVGLTDGKLMGERLKANSLAFSPDGSRFAMVEARGATLVVTVRDTRSRERLVELPVDIDRYQLQLAWSDDGEWLAVYGDRAAVALYEVSKRRRVGPVIRWSGSTPIALAFAPDRRSLLMTDSDRQVLRLELDPVAWEALACSVANRNLTFDEWAALKGSACYRPTCPGLPPDPDLASVPDRLARAGDTAMAERARQCLQTAGR